MSSLQAIKIMSDHNSINILIAEDNDISRALMASVLKTQNYTVFEAIDGGQAIEIVNEEVIDLALVDLNMEPKGGFDFVRYLVANGIELPVVIITADESSDVLTRASDLGVTRVLQKPVEPDRLLSLTQSVLKRYGHTFQTFGSYVHETQYTPEQLMQRAIELAERNARSQKGGPFGAVIANANGEILGEGTNGVTSRVDPTAHSEIMAIRQAAEKLGQADLSTCVLYCSSAPTAMGRALIASVGIEEVYFGLAHDDIRDACTRERKSFSEPDYKQICRDDALKMFSRWQALDERLED